MIIATMRKVGAVSPGLFSFSATLKDNHEKDRCGAASQESRATDCQHQRWRPSRRHEPWPRLRCEDDWPAQSGAETLAFEKIRSQFRLCQTRRSPRRVFLWRDRKFLSAAVGVVTLPVSAAVDVVTLGGALIDPDEPYTVSRLSASAKMPARWSRNWQEAAAVPGADHRGP